MRPGESGGGGAEKRPPGGASRRYHPYSIGGRWGEGDRGGGGRKRSRSRSYYSRSPPPGPSDRTPSPRRYKKYAAIKMAAEKELVSSYEELLRVFLTLHRLNPLQIVRFSFSFRLNFWCQLMS